MGFAIRYITLLLLLLPVAYAELQLSPSSVSVSTHPNQEQKIELTFTNKFNFTIYNLTFSQVEDVIFPRIDSLAANETRKANISVKSNSTYVRSRNSVVKFYYFTSIQDIPVNYNVTINDTRFIPSELSLENGDSVTWYNKGNLPHTITALNGEFDFLIQPNGSKRIDFSEVKEIEYQDLNSINQHGYLHITNKSIELTTNQNYNIILPLSITSSYSSTQLALELIDSRFNITQGAGSEALLKVINQGAETAFNVTLKAERWISFAENSFDLLPSQVNYVSYLIAPLVNATSQTNKTHEIDITAKADNSNAVSKTIDVFIPYEEDIIMNASSADWWREKTIFCRENPRSPFCIAEPVREKDTQYITVDQHPEINISESDYLKDREEVRTRLTSIDSKFDKLGSHITDETSKMKDMQSALTETQRKQAELLNETLRLAQDNYDDVSKEKVLRTVLVWIGVILVASAVCYIVIRRRQTRLDNLRV